MTSKFTINQLCFATLFLNDKEIQPFRSNLFVPKTGHTTTVIIYNRNSSITSLQLRQPHRQ